MVLFHCIDIGYHDNMCTFTKLNVLIKTFKAVMIFVEKYNALSLLPVLENN